MPPPVKFARRPLAAMARAAFWTLTALALPGCVLATAAYFSSAPAVLAQLSPFRVQYAVLLAAHAAFCLALRRRRWAALFAAFALLNLAAVLRPALTAPVPVATPDPARPALKILLSNVLASNPDASRLLALIAAEKPDLVALLEVNARWRDRLAPALADAYPYSAFHPREDNFGVALLSRLPPGGGRLEFFADAETPSIDFTLPCGDRRVRVLITHALPPGDAATTALRDQHLAELAKWVAFVDRLPPGPTPALILGDLNATPWCPPLRRLLAATGLRPAACDHGWAAPSWPVPVPFLRIPLDHALLGPGLACTAYRIGPDIGSDHFPVLLEIAPAAPR